MHETDLTDPGVCLALLPRILCVSGVLIFIKFFPVCDQKNLCIQMCPSFLAGRGALDPKGVGMGGRGVDRPQWGLAGLHGKARELVSSTEAGSGRAGALGRGQEA